MPAEACIGSLEHHIHKVFASVRIPGEDFVYSTSADLYSALDAYCDDRTIGESRAPFLIMGESGTGKSALLSNWLQRRKRQAVRSRSSDEFIFWHAVGCSRQSLNINSLIRRLIMDLKARFEITRDVPTTQERLSWELPRFLELASKRGKVIVVVDGLHRIATNDSSEANLAWLPLVLPPGIRFVLSATSPSPIPKGKTVIGTARPTSPTISNSRTNSPKGVSIDVNAVSAALSEDDDMEIDESSAEKRVSKFLLLRKERSMRNIQSADKRRKESSKHGRVSFSAHSVQPSTRYRIQYY
jgi:hypothetical protein